MTAEIRRLRDLLELLPSGSSAREPQLSDGSTPEEQRPNVYVVESDVANDVIQLGAFTSMEEAVKALDLAQVDDPVTQWVINVITVHELAQHHFKGGHHA